MALMIEHHRVETDGATLHVAVHGEGPCILAVHGWPQTWREWTGIMERLGKDFRIIAPDLRGCGDSSKPFAGYDARSVAMDLLAVLDHFEIERSHVIGHDIGAAPAYALCALNSGRIHTLSLIEAPLWGITSATVPDLPNLFWHLQFHQDVDLAAALISGHEGMYLSHFFRHFAYNPSAVGSEDTQAYVAAYTAPGGLRASLEHYRAIPESSRQLQELSRTRLSIPVLALGGSAVMGEYVINAARLIAEDVHGGVVPNCGHWMAEEQPEALAAAFAAHAGRVASG